MVNGTESGIKFFELTRAQIQHEDGLINNRISWLLSTQALLFTAYAFAINAGNNATTTYLYSSKITCEITKNNNDVSHQVDNIKTGLVLVSLVTSVALFLGIAAAMNAIIKLRDDWYKKEARNEDSYPQIIGNNLPMVGIQGGIFPAYVLPMAVTLLWCYISQNTILVILSVLTLLLFCSIAFVINKNALLSIKSRISKI